MFYSQLVHKLQAFDPEWEARLAKEVCLVRMDTLRTHDILIRDGTHGKRSDDRQFRRTLSPRGARVQYTEIHDSGTVVLRRFKSSVWVPAWPLRLLGNDNIFRHDYFDWSLKTLSNRPGEYRYDLLQALLEHSNAFGQAGGTAAAGQE